MQNRPILRKLIPIILILGLIWGVFFISRTVLQKPEYSNLDFLPEYAGWSVQIDLHTLMDKGISTILFEEEDAEVKELIQDLATNQDGRFQNFMNYGIQINSSLLIFALENSSIIGASINLNDTEKFNTNLSEELPSNFACYGENNVGIILYSTKNTIDAEKLLTRAKEIINQPHLDQAKSQFDLSLQLHPDNNLLENFTDGTINVQFAKNKILISGEMDSFDSISPKKYTRIKKDGFHVDLVNVTKLVSDSILHSLELELPQIASASINYFGAELITEPKMTIDLNMNGIFTFSESLYVDQSIDSAFSKKFTQLIDLGYQVHSINENTLYIGRDKFDTTKVLTESRYLKIVGDPSSITELKGEGFTRKLIGIIPLFKASDKLSHSINNVDIEVNIVNNDKAKIKGVITFDDEKYAINELLKFILISQQ